VRADLPLQMSDSSEYGYGTSGLGIDTGGDTIAAQIFVANGPNPNVGPSQVQVFKRTAGVYSKVAELSPGAWQAPSTSTDSAAHGDWNNTQGTATGAVWMY
jgi:hypothetical protein